MIAKIRSHILADHGGIALIDELLEVLSDKPLHLL
jgi:hypothetical protein